ncbi:MAG: peptidoglycan-binding domain-containing protein [Pararhodobacter sp.]
MLRLALPLILFTTLAACQSTAPAPAVSRAEAAPLTGQPLTAIEGACWSTASIPAVTETVFVEVPGQTGRQPREQQLRPAEDRLFAVPCPEQIDDTLVASLQRALTARGLYDGPVNGDWDAETSAAVRRYQAPQGLDSGILSLQAAQMLGLVVAPRTNG